MWKTKMPAIIQLKISRENDFRLAHFCIIDYLEKAKGLIDREIISLGKTQRS